jgi:hypothetical protein
MLPVWAYWFKTILTGLRFYTVLKNSDTGCSKASDARHEKTRMKAEG